MRMIIATLAILCTLHSWSVSARENFCHDPKSWDDWNELVKKNPDDVEIQIAHALRIGLCVNVEKGSIGFEDATDVMNSWMDSMIQKRREQVKKAKDSEM